MREQLQVAGTLPPGKENTAAIGKEDRWVPEPVRTLSRTEEILFPVRNRTTTSRFTSVVQSIQNVSLRP